MSMDFTNIEGKRLYKQGLKAKCVELLRERIDTARQAMEAAQESANNDSKSSAGDKYETGRAMSQIDRDRSAGQMDEAIQDLIKLQSIDIDTLNEEVKNGSVIFCGANVYFIATGLGAISYQESKVIVLSPRAPLSNMLRGKLTGDKITFSGNDFVISNLF